MNRGDIWHVDLNPIKGREQANPRYVLILTSREFNQLGTPIVAPITTGGNFARTQGFLYHLRAQVLTRPVLLFVTSFGHSICARVVASLVRKPRILLCKRC